MRYTEEWVECDSCGEREEDDGWNDNIQYYEGINQDICESCREDQLSVCEYCDEWHDNDDMTFCDIPICATCTDDYHHDRMEEGTFEADEDGICTSCDTWEDQDFIDEKDNRGPSLSREVRNTIPGGARNTLKWDISLP